MVCLIRKKNNPKIRYKKTNKSMLTYQCLKCEGLEKRVDDVDHVNDVSFIELRVYENYGTYGK